MDLRVRCAPVDTDQTSRRIRVAFVAMLVLGLVLSFTKASLWLAPDGARSLEPDLEALAYLNAATMALNIIGWMVVLLGIRTLAGRNEGGGPLTVALWCWGLALVLDFAWLGVPFLAADVDISALLIWSGRVDIALMTAGAVASVMYARDAGLDTNRLSAAAVGLLIYVVVLLAQNFEGLLNFDWFWGIYILFAFARIGLLGSMAILPWAPVVGSERPAGTPSLGGPSKEGSASADFVIGAIFLGGGVAVTYASWTGGGIGGRTVLAWGPIVYGLYRIIRGLSR